MSNQQLAEHLREVGVALKDQQLSMSEAANLADGLLRDAKDRGAFKGTLLERIVGGSPNIIRVARWEDDEIQKNIDLAYEIGDPDDLEAVQCQAIIKGCAKMADFIKESDKNNGFMVKPETREAEVLQVLFEAKAFDVRSKMTVEEITKQAGGEDYKRPVNTLRKEGFVETARGPKGGVWLSEKGKAEAARLPK